MTATFMAASTAASGVLVAFTGKPYAATNIGIPAAVTVARAGTVAPSNGGTFDWAHPKNSTVGDAYTVRIHADSGSLVGDTQDADLALSSDRSWSSASASATLTIKQGGATLDTASITFTQT